MPSTIKIINNDKSIEIDYDDKENADIVYKYIYILRNNAKRLRYSHYKNVSGIRGSTRKIRPQKKMGKSRQGSNYELHMRGGAVKFGFSGDKERDYGKRYAKKLKINKKEKQLCQKIILHNKIKNQCLKIIDLSNIPSKTKETKLMLEKNNLNQKSSQLVFSNDENIKSFQSLKTLNTINISNTNILNIIKTDEIIFSYKSFIDLANKLKIKYQIK